MVEAELETLPPGPPRPCRSWHEVAAAGRADIAENAVRTVGAVGAFIAANACVRCIGRQVSITPLAVRPQFEHSFKSLLPVSRQLEGLDEADKCRASENQAERVVEPPVTGFRDGRGPKAHPKPEPSQVDNDHDKDRQYPF